MKFHVAVIEGTVMTSGIKSEGSYFAQRKKEKNQHQMQWVHGFPRSWGLFGIKIGNTNL
jgi:hypothetical protein